MGATVSVRCPACKGRSFTLYEKLEVANGYRVQAGERLERFAVEEMPVSTGFTATCDCGHRWVPRYSSASEVMDAGEGA